MFRKSLILLLSLCFISGCSNVNNGAYKSKVCKGPEIVSSGLLTNVGLELAWQNDMPVKSGEKLKSVFLTDKYVFGLTDTNYLICLDRFDGNLRYVKDFTTAGFPVVGPTAFEGDLFFAVGKDVLSLNPVTGQVDKVISVKNPVLKPVKLNKYKLFVTDGSRVLVYDRKTNVLVAQYSAMNDAEITDVCVNEDSAYYSTKSGEIIRASVNEAKRYWTTKLPAAIENGLVIIGDDLYACCIDTNLAKLSGQSGSVKWRVSLGDELKEPVVAGMSSLYVNAGMKGVYSLMAEDGCIAWQLGNGRKFVSEDVKTAYVFTADQKLTGVDKKAGKKVFDVNFRNVSNCALNLFDSNIYAYDNSGRLACIKTGE